MFRFLVVLFFLPCVVQAQSWTRSEVPNSSAPGAEPIVDGYRLSLGQITCYVGRFRSDNAVVFQLWKKVTASVSNVEDVVVEARSAKLLQFFPLRAENRVFIIRPAIPDFNHPCRAHIQTIPHREIRDVLSRFSRHLDSARDIESLFVGGKYHLVH